MQATVNPEAPTAPPKPAGRARAERWSAGIFALAVIAAVPLLLWFGREHWFFLDDWWVLARDGLTRPGYLDAHNGHWVTLLRFDYRLNFELWGLHSYLPYQVPVVLAHVGTAVLLRLVMLLLGVRGWIATAAALGFLFFGAGRENMVYGFQVSLTGSVLCGLAMFLLVEGPPSVTRRDWLALGVGVVGLMTSGVFPAILVGLGVTILLRRGLWVAAFYAGPLGVIYTTWYLAYGRDTAMPLDATGQTFSFAGRMFWATFEDLAQGVVGAVLLAVAALGLAVAVSRAQRSGMWTDAALPLGLAVAWVTFAAVTALARASVELTAETYNAGRYLHVGAALLLPLVAAGTEVLARCHIWLGAVALVPLAMGIPGNVDKLAHTEPIFAGNRQHIFAMAHSPFVDEVPRTTALQMGPFRSPLTTGWLARQAAAGRIPEPDGIDPVRDLTATNDLVLSQETSPAGRAPCPRLAVPLTLSLRSGDRIEFAGTISVAVIEGAQESYPRQFLSRDGPTIRALAGPVEVVVRPALGQQAHACVPAAGDG